MKVHFLSIFIAFFLLTGCASTTTSGACGETTIGCSDPLEGFNRAMFNINYNVLDPYLLKPVAKFWRYHIPKPIRTSVINATTNITEPSSMVNYLLQGNVKQASMHLTRFIVNTVFGLGGLFDIAGTLDSELKQVNERNFGHVLGHYGVPYGPYLVLPGMGSMAIRQGAGNYVDNLYPVLSLLTFGLRAGVWIVNGIDARANVLDLEEMIHNSPDPYSFMRNAYYQRQNFVTNEGAVPQASSENVFSDDVLNDIDDY